MNFTLFCFLFFDLLALYSLAVGSSFALSSKTSFFSFTGCTLGTFATGFVGCGGTRFFFCLCFALAGLSDTLFVGFALCLGSCSLTGAFLFTSLLGSRLFRSAFLGFCSGTFAGFLHLDSNESVNLCVKGRTLFTLFVKYTLQLSLLCLQCADNLCAFVFLVL